MAAMLVVCDIALAEFLVNLFLGRGKRLTEYGIIDVANFFCAQSMKIDFACAR